MYCINNAVTAFHKLSTNSETFNSGQYYFITVEDLVIASVPALIG